MQSIFDLQGLCTLLHTLVLTFLKILKRYCL